MLLGPTGGVSGGLETVRNKVDCSMYILPCNVNGLLPKVLEVTVMFDCRVVFDEL